MATALDLLMSAKEDVNLLSEESDICTIDAKTRTIFVPSTIVVGGVQSDKNAERIKFSCPKIVGDNLDLSKFSVRINFENVSSVDFNVSIKDQYICDDVAVDGENVTFSWLIGRNAARYMGTVRFIVCAVKTDSDSNISVEWNTAIAEVPVLEGIEIDQPQIGQEEKDVINQLLELTKNTSAEAVQNVNSAKEQAIKDIQSVSQPDTTLTIEGGLAEAKATGEAIGSLKEEIVNIIDDLQNTQNILNTKNITNTLTWENGSYTDNGMKKDGNAIRNNDANKIDKTAYIVLKDKKNYILKVIEYNLDKEYVGVVNNKSSDYKITESGMYKIAVECKNSTLIAPEMISKIISIEKVIDNNFASKEDIKQSDNTYTDQFNNVIIAIGDGIYDKTYSVTNQKLYNSWSFVAPLYGGIICLYTKGTNHADATSADIYMSKSKNGVVWSEEEKIISTQNTRDTVTGIGNDANDNIIFWNRVGDASYPDRFELYRTSDGNTFEKISEPNFSYVCSHIGDIINIPNVGLMCFWNTYRHNNSNFGYMISADNGLTWTQKVIQSYTEWKKCPTEFTLAYIGDNKIIAMGRSEEDDGAMFQVTSTDNGSTWAVNTTNITDTWLSTPSFVYKDNGYLHLYYYDRKNGKLKRRVSIADNVFNNPTNWDESVILSSGEKWSNSGNANATKFKYNNNVLVSYYSGNDNTTNIYSVVTG